MVGGLARSINIALTNPLQFEKNNALLNEAENYDDIFGGLPYNPGE